MPFLRSDGSPIGRVWSCKMVVSVASPRVIFTICQQNNLEQNNHHPRVFGNDLGVSKNSGTPKSSILIGFSIINHPFWGFPSIFGSKSI